MHQLRKHWFDLGGLFSILVIICLYYQSHYVSTIQVILCVNLIALFIHQLEEYRYPGYFPGMMNTVMYKSDLPDRYPLNSQTSLVVNVLVGWLTYILALIFANTYIWLGIATMLVSLGNFIAHTFLFNFKGRTFYNPGMATAILFFLPIVIWFSNYMCTHNTTVLNWITGIALGLALNVIGILKVIDWMADRNTSFLFETRQLLQRNSSTTDMSIEK
jgi:hypothetical protein